MSPTTTRDNAEPLDGWQVTPKHCGLICFAVTCPVCGMNPQTPATIERGEN